MDDRRLRFVATGLAWAIAFGAAFASLATSLGGGLTGAGVSILLAVGVASGLYAVWPALLKQPKLPTQEPTVLPAKAQPSKPRASDNAPASSTRIRVCSPGPYRVKPGAFTKIPLDVRTGDSFGGSLLEGDNWDFDWRIVDEI